MARALTLLACVVVALLSDSAYGVRVGSEGGSASLEQNATDCPICGRLAFPAVKSRHVPRVTRIFPADLVWHILCFVPQPVQILWSAGRKAPRLLSLGHAEVHKAFELHGHAGGSKDARFFPQGDRLITIGFEGLGVIWDVQSGRPLHELRHSPPTLSRILDMQVFPGGDRVVTLGAGGDAIIWCAGTGEALHRIVLTGVAVHWIVRVPPEGDRIVTGVSGIWLDPAVVWDVSKSRPRHTLRQPHDTMRLLELSPCGTRLVTAGFQGVFLWNVVDGSLERELPAILDVSARIAVSEGGAKVIASSDGRVRVWNGVTGRLCRRIFVGLAFAHFALLEGGDRIVAFAPWGAASVWDIRSGAKLFALRGVSGGGKERGRHLHPFESDVVRIITTPRGHLAAACGLYWSPKRSHEPIEWATVWGASTGRVLFTSQAPSLQSEMFCSIAIGPLRPMAEKLVL